MRHLLSRFSVLLVVTAAAACIGEMPPPPNLTVTSPQRGLVQNGAGTVTVTGIARPGPDGGRVTKVSVNQVPAMLAADGSFSVLVDVPPGATLLETVAISEAGGAATDARAVHVGELRPVGTAIDRAVTATLSADAFARLSVAANSLLKARDLSAMLAPLQPMADLGDSIANVRLSITKLTLGDVTVSLTPVDGGLTFSATLDGLDVGATAAYGGALVVDGSTTIGVKADRITIAGTLVVSPAGTSGFTTTITTPTVRTTNLKLDASGLVGSVLDLVNDNLGSTVQSLITKTAERALEPLINTALGALAGPQSIDVLGETLDLQASPSAVTFTTAGALVTMNLTATLAGSETSPGYIFTPNGTPTMNVGSGIQLAIADDLLNGLLAQVHELGILDLHLTEDFGVFDTADFKLALPPMISANNTDGSLRLVLGDMIATVSDNGTTLISAAVNADVELSILRGTTADEIALQFGKVRAYVNILGGEGTTTESGAGNLDLGNAAAAGIGIQLDSLSAFLVKVPVPTVAGVSFDNLAVRADSGYVVMSGQIH